jgi:hypothetical protein
MIELLSMIVSPRMHHMWTSGAVNIPRRLTLSWLGSSVPAQNIIVRTFSMSMALGVILHLLSAWLPVLRLASV